MNFVYDFCILRHLCLMLLLTCTHTHMHVNAQPGTRHVIYTNNQLLDEEGVVIHDFGNPEYSNPVPSNKLNPAVVGRDARQPTTFHSAFVKQHTVANTHKSNSVKSKSPKDIDKQIAIESAASSRPLTNHQRLEKSSHVTPHTHHNQSTHGKITLTQSQLNADDMKMATLQQNVGHMKLRESQRNADDLKMTTSQRNGEDLKMTKSQRSADDLKMTSSLVEDFLYWSQDVERLLPQGQSDEEVNQWRMRVHNQKVKEMERGTLKKCGRGKNAYLVLSDGTQMCARNTYPATPSVASEICAFQLSRVLNMRTLPAITLANVSTQDGSLWEGQRSEVDQVMWHEGEIVSLTQWIHDLGDLYIPRIFLEGSGRLTPSNPVLRTLNHTDLVTLVHWTELIVFDYIIGHIDRLTITYEGFREYNEPKVLLHSLHNVNRISKTGAICIVDNECAFTTGYSILNHALRGDRMKQIYDELLASVCIFRRATVEAIEQLVAMDNIPVFLIDRIMAYEPLFKSLPGSFSLKSHTRTVTELTDRIQKIHRHIEKCRVSNQLGDLK